MSLAIQWGVKKGSTSQGFIYFDTVTSYSTEYNGSVTSHPISSGSNIADHFVRDNVRVSIDAVISGVDISSSTHLISDKKDGSGNKPTNTRTRELKPVTINQKKSWNDFLPESIGQFFSPNTPEVTPSTDQQGRGWRLALDNILKLFKDGEMQFVTLYEYERNLMSHSIENLVLTSIRFYEDPDTGDALFCSLSLEQVSTVTTKSVELPKEVADKMKLQASPLANKTPVNTTEVGVVSEAYGSEPIPHNMDYEYERSQFLYPYNPTNNPDPFKTYVGRYGGLPDVTGETP